MSNRERIASLRAANPRLTATELARITGLSRERVRQILVALGLPTRCNRSLRYLCNQCARPTSNKLFCSLKCLREFNRIELVCEVCGRHFNRPLKEVRHGVMRGQQKFYCSKQHQGHDTGKLYGLAAHPEIRRMGVAGLRKLQSPPAPTPPSPRRPPTSSP